MEIKNRVIDDDHPPYVIAEIGCNHGGDFELCKEMVWRAADCGVNAVKLQKRFNRVLFTNKAFDEPYSSESAYGPTYGLHREALELNKSQFMQIKAQCEQLGIAFIATPFEEKSADFLREIDLDAYKIASCDVRYPQLIEKVSGFGKPVIISTGGASRDDVIRATNIMERIGTPYALMQCTSTYPNVDNELNLSVISEWDISFPYYNRPAIGFSSHHPGILPHIIAYTQGARIFEAHFTLDRSTPGTDHGFSLEPEGLRKLCTDLNRINSMIGYSNKRVWHKESISNGFPTKQGKSIYLKEYTEENTMIAEDDICFKAPAVGMFPYEAHKVIGKVTKMDIDPDTAVLPEMLAEVH